MNELLTCAAVILLMLGAYALMIDAGFSINTIVIVFGLFVSVTMGFLTKKTGS